MKKIDRFKFQLFQVTVFTFLLVSALSCSNQKAQDTKDIAQKENDVKFENTDEEKDAKFLVNAAEINLEEISLGKLAQQNGTQTYIKDLGKMMENAHTKALKELTAIAQKKAISIPTSPTNDSQDAYKKLNEKSGNDFDKKYADMMVSGHKDAIAVFEKAIKECKDTDIKDWATAMLPELHSHLDQAINCQRRCEKL